MGLSCSIVVQEHERWLCCDVERRPDSAGFVNGVGEGIDFERVDEVSNRVEIISSCDSDELHILTVLLLHLCDRRGFCSARASPRSPEPKHDVLTCEAVPIELSTIGGWKEKWLGRRRDVVGLSALRRTCGGILRNLAGTPSSDQGQNKRDRCDSSSAMTATALVERHRATVPPIPMAGYSLSKDDYLSRLKRIEGQVRGLQRMVDEDTYCIDVLTQISSVTKALQNVGVGLVDEHLRHCVRDAVAESPEAGGEKIDEATAAIARLLRS